MAEATPGTTAVSIMDFAAGIFDLDGVVTRSATVHAASWKRLFDDYLSRLTAQTGKPYRPFDDADYRRYVDGKPRYQGVESFLESRGIALDYGSEADPPESETICGLGNLKNRLFHEHLAQEGIDVYGSSVAFIRALRQAGLKTALVSSSKNATAVLESAGLQTLFDVQIDGLEAERLQLKGKPDPAVFQYAARLLGVAPAQAFVVEDALSGVQAGRRAGFGMIIGVDRANQRQALLECGADIVVDDLAELLPGHTSPQSVLPDALEHYGDIARRLTDKRPAVFLDYDGTLTPIVDRPELAVLREDMRKAVRELAAHCTVAIVSGRDRADVEQLVGLDELVYAGSHGFDIAGPSGLRMEQEQAAEFLPALGEAEAWLQQALAPVPGAQVERKRFAIAVHFRLVPEDSIAAVEAAVDAALAEAKGKLRKTGGKKIFELRPRLPWDKGRAVRWLIDALGLARPDVLPFYLGDDETDEDAFAAVRELGGVGVLVATDPQPSAAHYCLDHPDAVVRFLRTLEKASA